MDGAYLTLAVVAAMVWTFVTIGLILTHIPV